MAQGRETFCVGRSFLNTARQRKRSCFLNPAKMERSTKSFLSHPLLLSLSVEAKKPYALVGQDSQPAWPCCQAAQTQTQMVFEDLVICSSSAPTTKSWSLCSCEGDMQSQLLAQLTLPQVTYGQSTQILRTKRTLRNNLAWLQLRKTGFQIII